MSKRLSRVENLWGDGGKEGRERDTSFRHTETFGHFKLDTTCTATASPSILQTVSV